jgi:hypothetical protein
MYILKMEYLERRGAAQDSLFASGLPCSHAVSADLSSCDDD